jgi:hypothetical protein
MLQDSDDTYFNIVTLLHEQLRKHKDLLAEVLERGSFKKSDLKDRIIAAIKAFRATYQPV